MKNYLKLLWEACVLFNRRSGAILSAASSFYVLLTIVPLFLLIIRAVGIFIGDIAQVQSQTFSLVLAAFPSVLPGMIEKLQNIVSGPLFGSAKFTVINFVILAWSSLSFFNSIWNGLYIMTDDHKHVSIWKHLKGIVVIGITIGLVVFVIGVPPLVMAIINFIRTSETIETLSKVIPGLSFLKSYILSFTIGKNFLLKSIIFSFFIFLGYFTVLYRWFFAWKLSWKESVTSSAVFVLLLYLGKNLFWVYLMYVRENLIKNYGDYYTFILGIIWIFLVMNFFFLGASLCHVFMVRNKLLQEKKDD